MHLYVVASPAVTIASRVEMLVMRQDREISVESLEPRELPWRLDGQVRFQQWQVRLWSLKAPTFFLSFVSSLWLLQPVWLEGNYVRT